ncbi:beta-glucosidase [Motilibacter rhizosphaerae]|uniref:Exo-alpha-(1->6)-L-arabinopyranosidase n=1 Tax=Motilibacter rhizosphaerae TaxID=598652 RepID=A0A4Q7NAR8_9ACTN|nr:glycoside hydrolase family 3 C-terminal domain-containing protein [Motilibacter rhizosphaerae]RZS80038.1 beta-glucosidase [Motilibacter rhizosphaerae]
MHRWATRLTVLSAAVASALAGSATAVTAAHADTAAGSPIYLDRSYSPVERATDLVSRMTLAEKAAELDSSRAPAIPRLGVAAWGWWNEANHGINASTLTASGNATTLTNTTSYPSDLSLGSTWDPDLVYKEAGLIGDEARDVSPANRQNLDFYAPTVNLTRDPRWGRNDESWSEDPTLTAALASQYVDGLQGQTQDGKLLPEANGYYKAIATLKHYAANNSEVNRRQGSSDMDERTLREYYTKQFADIVQQAHPGSIMSSYNEVNGVPAAASVKLIDTMARQQFGFDGYFTSDCDAVEVIQKDHHWQPPGAPAPLDQYGRTAYALSAGEDLDCNAGYSDAFNYGNTIPTAIAQHIQTQTDVFNEGDVDVSAVRLFTARIETGEFDDEASVPWVQAARQRLGGTTWVSSEANGAITETPERLAQARTSADESIVLLKNSAPTGAKSPLLPLKVPHTGAYKVAVMGYFAHPSRGLYLGGYSSIQTASGQAKEIDAYTGIKNAVTAIDPSAQVDFLPGVTGGTSASSLNTVDAASIAAAKGYDAVIVVAGTDGGTSAEDRDRTTIALPGAQSAMIQQAEAANPNTVVYLETVGEVAVGSFKDSTNALLWSSYNGERQGDAIADVLLGKVNPSGHLPFTWYADDSQLPSILDYTIRPTATNPGRTYQYFTGTPTYPFGYGLSYSTFDYEKIRVSNWSETPDGTITVHARVRNTSDVDGTEVAQLYVTTPNAPSSAERPTKRLLAFQRVTLQAGHGASVVFTVPASKLAFWDTAAGKYVVDPGHYGLEVGGNSADIAQTDSIDVHGTLTVKPAVLTAKPIQSGDVENQVAQRVFVDPGKTIDPQLTVSMTDQSIYGYITKGQSKPLPAGTTVTYSSNRPSVVGVQDGTLKALGTGIATVTATLKYHGASVSTTFTVDVVEHVALTAPALVTPGSTFTATATLPSGQGAPTLTGVSFALDLPQGWSAQATTPTTVDSLPGGQTATVSWQVTVPADAQPGDGTLTATASFTSPSGAGTASASTSVTTPYPSLVAAYSNASTTNDGTAGAYDGAGRSFSAQALAGVTPSLTPGATFTHDGATFTWPSSAIGTPDNVWANGQTIAVSGSGSTLHLIGAANNGTATGTLRITYTDGTTQDATLSYNDWWGATPAAGTDVLVATPYHLLNGVKQNQKVGIYDAQIPLQAGKTLAYLTLPKFSAPGTPGLAMHVWTLGLS